jgi:hypothetical protein
MGLFCEFLTEFVRGDGEHPSATLPDKALIHPSPDTRVG